MTEKTPNSVKFGSRPRITMIFSYSAGVMPWLATNSEVIAGWTNFLLAISAMPLGLFNTCDRDGGKNFRAIVTAQQFVASVFRVRHQAEDIARFVADAGDIFQRAVGIGRGGRLALGIDVAQSNLPVL